MNITEELGKYLKDFAKDYFVQNPEILEDSDKEGRMRDICYTEIGELFDDAMGEFCLEKIIEDIIEEKVQEIKDLLYEMPLRDYKEQNIMDEKIGKLEKEIEKLRDLE